MIAKSSGSWPHLQQRHAGVGLAGGELNFFTIQEERDAVGVGRHADRRRGGRRVKKEGYEEEDLHAQLLSHLQISHTTSCKVGNQCKGWKVGVRKGQREGRLGAATAASNLQAREV